MQLAKLSLLVLTYCVLAFLFFGSPIQPVGFVTLYHHLFWENWRLGVIAAMLPALLISSSYVFPNLRPNVLRPAVFMASWMLICVVPTGLYADWVRKKAIVEFDPDSELQHSFFRSLHEVPADFQFYVHTAILKNCVPYLWSYRSMTFKEFRNPNVAVNVLPPSWLEQCNIKRVP